MSKKLKNILIIISIYLGVILLSIILSGGVGLLYSNIFNAQCDNSLFIMANFDKGCMIEGFIYSYIFLLAISIFLFLDTKRGLIFYFLGTFLLWLEGIFSILIEDLWLIRKTFIMNLFVMLLLFFGGWTLAKIFLLIKRKTKTLPIPKEKKNSEKNN